MFCDNNNLLNATKKLDITFHKFYNLFIRNAFNIFFAEEPIELILYFDQLPDKKERNFEFKYKLINSIMKASSNKNHIISLKKENIYEVDSKKHYLLGCIDVVVGLIDYFANKYSSNQVKSKRELGRIKVLNHLLSLINDLVPNIDYFKSTKPLYNLNAWKKPYGHYLYKISEKQKIYQYRYYHSRYKNNAPANPT